MAEVGQGLFLGDTPITSLFGNDFVFVNPFELVNTPVLTNSVLMLDGTNPSSYPGSGTTWFDISGNGNDADVNGITSYWNSNGYFDWPGTDYTKVGVVQADASLDIFGGNFTCMLVGSVDASAGGLSDSTGPFSMDDWNDNPGIGWLINRNSSDGNFRKGNFYLNGSGVGLSTGLWFDSIGDLFVLHVVRSGSTITYYDTSNSSIGSFSNSTNGNNNNRVIFGRAADNASFNYKWDGKIASIGFYSSALTSDQRQVNIDYFKNKLGF